MNNLNPKSLFIISGPSGAGEDSVIDGLKKYFLIERVITTTTRQMRPGERQGHPYYFISKKDFQKKIKENQFFEWAEEYGRYYGVSREEIERVKNSGKIGVWKIAYKGVITAKKLMPDILAILISAPLDILEKRIRLRNPEYSDDFIKERIDYTKEWLKNKDIYDYEVINEQGKLDETVKKTAEIIKKHLNVDKALFLL